MGHDHVAVGAGVLVEAGAVVDAEGLGDVDLHVVDVVAVPDRLEHAVGEAQRDQVLHRLAAEEVVDPEHAILRHDAVHEGVELARAVEVDAERLLQHEARAVGQPGGPERRDRVTERVRRDREVVQAPRLSVEFRLGARHGLLQGLGLLGAEPLNDSRAEKRSHVSPAASPIAARATRRKSSSEPPLREVPMIL